MFYNKPIVLKKFKSFIRSINSNEGKIGKNLRGMIINYNNRCNFSCQHCFTQSAEGDSSSSNININDVKRVCDELDELGGWELEIQGGEPLMFPNLSALIESIGSSRFLVVITTNGWFLSEEKAHELKKLGIDRVAVSLDSFIAKEHDDFRGKKGAFSRAITALKNVKAAGMIASINFTIGHHNAYADSTKELIEFAAENEYVLNFIPMTPTGCYAGDFKYMLNQNDTKHVEQLRMEYPKIFRDLWSILDNDQVHISGCPSVNILYLNPLGDVLPCPFIHANLGNVLEKSLAEIVKAGFSIEHFANHSEKCLAGEDIQFVKKYLCNKMSVLAPIPAEKLFTRNC